MHIEPAAAALVERHSAQLLATARRYSLSAEDAEDAFQRGLEILLKRAPSVAEQELVPWMKTVVKHEAFSIRRARQRAELAGDPDLAGLGHVPGTHEQAERLERLRVGVEALGRLKPQEVRCLLLRAEGYSYKQICDETGFSYTKVNRCLTEGRRSFLDRVRGIESGAECSRLAPALSRLVDGEASDSDLEMLRPHLRSCLSCRATLRDYREAPARVAAVVPLAVVPGLLRRVGRFLSHLGFAKTAAVVAVAGSLVGGGVAVVHGGHSHHRQALPPAHAASRSVRTRPVLHERKHVRVRRRHRARAVAHRSAPRFSAPVAPTPAPTPTPRPAPAPTPAPAPRPAATSGEFGP